MKMQGVAQRPYRIAARGLHAGEAGLVRALVTLIANGRGADFPWVYGEQGADAVCTGGPSEDTLELRLPDGATVTLHRPLDARALERALDQAVAQRPAAEGTAGAAGEAAGEAGGAERYRLRRWPQAELLRADKQRVRLATMLSRQSLTVDELATLSGQPADRCRVFVMVLNSAGLLTVSQPLARVPQPEEARPARTEQVRGAGTARWSLVRSIRRKLGLGAEAA